MTVNELWPASDEIQWARLEEENGKDISTYTGGFAVLPAGTPLTVADVQPPLSLERPNTSTIRVQFKVDVDTLPTTVSKFNVWVYAAGGGEKISRVAGQLKRPRF